MAHHLNEGAHSLYLFAGHGTERGAYFQAVDGSVSVTVFHVDATDVIGAESAFFSGSVSFGLSIR